MPPRADIQRMLCPQIWDVGRMKQIRALKGHSARVSALAWSGTTLSSGGRDSNIINHDVRCAPDQEMSSRSLWSDLHSHRGCSTRAARSICLCL